MPITRAMLEAMLQFADQEEMTDNVIADIDLFADRPDLADADTQQVLDALYSFYELD